MVMNVNFTSHNRRHRWESCNKTDLEESGYEDARKEMFLWRKQLEIK
jgi:hypothetical protein